MAYRFDRGQLNSPTILSDGSMRCDAVITRSGVFDYKKPDGSVTKEYRPPNEVFRGDSLKTFELAAVTLDHQGLITADNRKDRAVGTVLEGVRQDGQHVLATLHVYDTNAIAQLKAGKNQVSCGYEMDLVPTPGTTPEGERYDAIQTNIRGNHVAIVDVARAGDSARVRMDAATMIVDGDKQMDETLKKALADLTAATMRADAAEREISALKISVAKLEGERDGAIAKAENAEKLRQDAVAVTEKSVRELVALEAQAARFLRNDSGDVESIAKLTPTQIKIKIVEKLSGKKVTREDSAYVDALYDFTLSSVGEADAAQDTVRVGAELSRPVREDGGASAVAKAREEMIRRNQTAYLGKGN